MSSPVLLDIPTVIKTSRLLLRSPQAGDGTVINQAIIESFVELHQWMPWAKNKPTVQDTEVFVRTARAQFITRESLTFLIFDATGTQFIGCISCFEKNWHIPHLEIGYWICTSQTGKGIATEATNALTRYAFEQLKVVRLQIKCDEDNNASRAIPEKLGFDFEGILKKDDRKMDGSLRNTAIYARFNGDGLPDLDVSWLSNNK